jgi:hypothetical protein
LNHDKGRDYIDYLGREVAKMAGKTEQATQSGAAPFRRWFTDVFAAR